MIKQNEVQLKPDKLNINLESFDNNTDPEVRLIVKHYQSENPYLGSISLRRSMFCDKKGSTYSQWITLFDEQSDDEYDGILGVNDQEDTKILVQLSIKDINIIEG